MVKSPVIIVALSLSPISFASCILKSVRVCVCMCVCVCVCIQLFYAYSFYLYFHAVPGYMFVDVIHCQDSFF